MSLVEQYRQYFSITNDANAHFYEVGRSPYLSPLANSPKSFGEETYQIGIIDQFKGKRPTLFNLEFMHSPDRYDLHLVVSIILDSQLVSELHAYRTSRDKMRPDKRRAVEQFLNWVSVHRYDFNPFFYYVESFCKSTHANFISAVTPVAASILHLHAMDENRFVERGEIVPRKYAIENYQDKYGAVSLDECAKNWLSEFLRTELHRFKPLVDATYACLLKMVLIHKMDGATAR